eukprot:CAMPEP_0197736810 /NCGR_PEP_ID=MMETSP1435-20131217/4248_1 /TAXON_ID=426625 /ORGANISM="Chaetoceros brevis, Strain CCMP164" /LENGTH=86 /DNA_ID=CAMNT_0043325067 /DNA_START=107 /DNA_END=367 /DNA_ORIENTATION=+
MGLTAALIGGASGTGIHIMTNAMRKVPLSRSPWFHVGYFFVGCWAGNKYVAVERKMVEDINQIREDKGMPPMVGTNAWIRYSEPQK